MCVIKAGTSSKDQNYSYLVMTETSGSNKCRNLHVFARKLEPFLKENNAEVASFLQKVIKIGATLLKNFIYKFITDLGGFDRESESG